MRRLALVLLSLISTAGCARVSLPSLPDLGRDDDAEAAAPAADPAAALDLTARVSSTGDAMPGPGDVEGVLKGVKVGTRDARITLDSVRP